MLSLQSLLLPLRYFRRSTYGICRIRVSVRVRAAMSERFGPRHRQFRAAKQHYGDLRALGADFIAKPYRQAALAAALRGALDTKKQAA